MTHDAAGAVVVHEINALREVLRSAMAASSTSADDDARSVGLVLSAGDLHAPLVRRSRADNARTVLSVGVSPAPWQNETERDEALRDSAHDVERARACDVDIVFAPSADELYPAGFATSLAVNGLTDGLEGAHHPRRLRGRAMEIALLLQLVRPTRVYLGEQDWQLLQLVRRFVRDLRFDVDVIGVPMVREADGLAPSRDNARLSDEAREGARSIAAALHQAHSLFAGGVRDVAVIESRLRTRLLDEPALEVEYAVVVDAESLQYVTQLYRPARALVAATIDGVRLIDNIALG